MYPSLLQKPVVPPEMSQMTGRGRGRILVVDDERAVREFIGAGLRAGGYGEVLYSSGGAGVPAMALSERPDLIIMDVMMPCGNGMRALRALRACAATSNIPVIITTGFPVPTSEDRASGRIDGMLAKPFSVEELLAEVGRHMAQTRG